MPQPIRFTLVMLLVGAAPLAAQDPAAAAQVARAHEDMIWAFMVPLAIIAAIVGLVYLARTLIEYRRWTRAVKLQTDAQTRIIDRLTAAGDVMAYLQSPAAERAMVLTADLPDARSGVRSPVSRILWSVQVGIVLALAGTGLWIGAPRAMEELADAIRIVAIVTTAVGVGFLLSAAASLVLSRRLGLLDEPAQSRP
ncbi:MAG TPA: hypothetical protein VFA27_09660 [Vicinamibacterales bacterium]|nr:hypothetical protein [Vicinamibacterales bacterium]